jgi:hypothetical protein
MLLLFSLLQIISLKTQSIKADVPVCRRWWAGICQGGIREWSCPRYLPLAQAGLPVAIKTGPAFL